MNLLILRSDWVLIQENRTKMSEALLHFPILLGKTVTVAVFADGDQAKEASDAGADFVGMEDLAEKFKKEEIDVDVVISSQAAMKVVGQLGRFLDQKA